MWLNCQNSSGNSLPYNQWESIHKTLWKIKSKLQKSLSYENSLVIVGCCNLWSGQNYFTKIGNQYKTYTLKTTTW